MLQRIIEFLRSGSFSQALAHQEAVREEHKRYLRRNAVEFAHTMEQVRGKTLTVGEHRESGREILAQVSLDNFLAHHLIQGRSGSGKSRYAESFLIQLLQSFSEVGVVIIDGKGELFERVRLWIAALLYKMDQEEQVRFLERVVIVDPFHPSLIPPLNFCVPAVNYPAELLAEDILGGLRRLFDEGLSVRMEVLLRNTLIALIEAGTGEQSLSLLEAKEFLTDEVFRARVLSQVQNEEVRTYFQRDFPHESRGTIGAVKGRLSYLLLSEQVRLSFGAGECVQFRGAISRGQILLINLGKNERATDKAREVVGTLLLSAFVRAVFSRPMNHGPYVLACMDEFQNFVLPEVFEKLYTEARAYRCFVTAICQQMAAQITSRALRDIILNNVRYITLFSSNEEEARLLGRIMFRLTGCLPKSGRLFSSQKGQRFYTEAEELEVYIRRVPSLKRQCCYFWDKESPFGAQLVSTRTVPEPYEFAGVSQEEFMRFCEDLEPFWKRTGAKKDAARKVIEERRKTWEIGTNAPMVVSPPSLDRRIILKKLEAHLGKGNKKGQEKE